MKEGGVLNAKHQSKSSGNGDFPEKKKREKNAGNSNKDHRSPNMHKKPIFNQRSSYSHVTSRLYYNTPRKKREHTSGDDEQDFNNANADINLDTLVKGGRGRGGGGSNKGGWKELNYDHRQKENERRRTRAERLRKVREEREKRRAMEKTWREEWEEEKKEVERKRKVKGCKRKFFFNRPLGPAALRRKKRSLKKSLKKSRNKSNQRQNQQRSGGHSENDSEVSSDDSDDDDFKKQIKQVRRMRGKSSTNKNKKNNKLSSKKRKMKKKPSSKYDECDAGDSSRPSWNTKWSATEGGKLFDAYQLKSVSVEYDDDEGVYFGPFNSPISAPASPISKTASAVTSPLASSSLSLSPSQQLSLDREGGGSRSRKPVIYNSPGGRAQVRDSDKKHFNADSADFFSSQMSKLRVNGAKDTDRGSKGDSKIRTDSNDDGSNDGDGKNVITERRRRREEGSLLVTISNQGESETKDERTSTEIIKATGGNSTANEQKSTQDYTTPKRIRKGRGSSGSDCSSAGGTLDGASSSVHTLVQSHYVIGSQTDRSHDRTKRQHHAASPISGIANTPTQKPPALPRELHLNLQQVHSNNPSIKLAPGALINANSYLIKKQYRERQLYLQHQLEHSPLPAHARDPSYRHSYHSPRIHSEHSQQLQGKHGRNNNSSRRRQNHHHLSDNFAAKQPYVSPRSPSQSNASTSTTPSFSSRKSRDVYEVVPCLSSRMIREQALRQVPWGEWMGNEFAVLIVVVKSVLSVA